jgi:outer membrane protein OmpA-like peptidoglycan-associated protein
MKRQSISNLENQRRLHRLCLALTLLGMSFAPVQAQKFILRQAEAPVDLAPAQPPVLKAVSRPSLQAAAKPRLRPEPKQVLHQALLFHEPTVKKHQPKEIIVLSCDQLFEPSKDLLTASGEAKLHSLSERLRARSGKAIVIVGHSDALGFEQFNRELSRQCAARVKSWIVSHGLIKSNTIEIRGAGSSEPVASETLPNGRDNAAGRARNRRVEIIIDPNVDLAQEIAEASAAARAQADREAAQKAALAPPVEDSGLVDMVPATVDDLTEHLPAEIDAANHQQSTHQSNTAEWGMGGTNFGDNIDRSFGGGGGNVAGFGGGGNAQFNNEGKRVQRVTPNPADQEKRIKDTIEAQNEFGLWRERW